MNWKQLLSAERLGRGNAVDSDPRSEFQRDYDRIVFSSAFRRLQDKTQVFPLSESDYVRTRLTHSMEVSCVGRSLGTLVGDFVANAGEIDKAQIQELGNIVAAACLAHDIGNPPFGHSGEDAIGSWFKEAGNRYLKNLSPEEKEDFLNFEGNAQGFRLISRLQNKINGGGLQLTYAVLGAYSKYPKRCYTPSLINLKKVSEKKFGFVVEDQSLFENVAKGLGLIKKQDIAWSRHPLAFLMEAADDICYRIVDLEDGCRLGVVAFEEAESLLKPLAFKVGENPSKGSYGEIDTDKGKIEYLRARAINTLILEALETFKINYSEIMNGAFENDLVSQSKFTSELNAIKTVSRNKVYSMAAVIEIEAAGFEILGGLLEKIVPALLGKLKKNSSSNEKILALIPKQLTQGKTEYELLLGATDFLSGMTDSFAITLYRRLKGIELPGRR